MHWWGKTIFTHPQKTFLTQVFCKLLSCHEFMNFNMRMRRFYSKGGSGCWATQWMNSPTGAWKWDFKVLNESSSWTFNARTVLKRSVIFFGSFFLLCSPTGLTLLIQQWVDAPEVCTPSEGRRHEVHLLFTSDEGGLTFSVGFLCLHVKQKMENLLLWRYFRFFFSNLPNLPQMTIFWDISFLDFLSFW